MKQSNAAKRGRSIGRRDGNGSGAGLPAAKKAKAVDGAGAAAAPPTPTAAQAEGKFDFFSWLLGVPKQVFFKEYFEKEHLVCSHGSAEYFTHGVEGAVPPVDWTTARMLQVVRERTLQYGEDLNIVRFDEAEKKRVAFKTTGPVTEAELKGCMDDGWSVRFLRPHEYFPCNSAFISLMEGLFHCYCGLNSYWTPAKSQGFAIHYDDVDVFLLQMEGEKVWQLYDPPEDVDYLSRHSSEDYLPEQFPTPKHTITLKPGDVLYMPRGMVHQGHTTAKTHSLHVTFSANQMHSWADLFLQATRHSVETLAANSVGWRRALPLDALRVLGEVNHPEFRVGSGLPPLSGKDAARRAEMQTLFRQFVTELSLLLTDEANIDVCGDLYAKEVVRKLQPFQRAFRPHIMGKDATVKPEAKVRLASGNCCRLMLNEPGVAQLFHNGENSVVCLAGELDDLRFEGDFAPALATLISRYPRPIAVSALPFPSFEDSEEVAENQLILCEALRDAGILEEVS